MTSEEIIRGIEHQDEAAGRALFEQYYVGGLRRLQNYFKYQQGVDIESLMQEVMLDLLMAIRRGSIKESSALPGYFNRILLNEAHQLARRRRYEVQFASVGGKYAVEFPSRENIEADLLRNEQRRQLDRAISQLKPKYQETVLACLWGDDVTAQAMLTGDNVGTLKSHKWRAILKLRKIMGIPAEAKTRRPKQNHKAVIDPLLEKSGLAWTATRQQLQGKSNFMTRQAN